MALVTFTIKNHEQYKSKYAPDGIEPQVEFRVPDQSGDLILTVTGSIEGGEAFLGSLSTPQIVVKAKITFKNALTKSGWRCPIYGANVIYRNSGYDMIYVGYPGGVAPIRKESGPSIPDGLFGKCDLRDGYPV